MQEYTLEIKQIVDYPRCRIYRQFVQALIADRSIRVSGGSGLLIHLEAFSFYWRFCAVGRTFSAMTHSSTVSSMSGRV